MNAKISQIVTVIVYLLFSVSTTAAIDNQQEGTAKDLDGGNIISRDSPLDIIESEIPQIAPEIESREKKSEPDAPAAEADRNESAAEKAQPGFRFPIEVVAFYICKRLFEKMRCKKSI
jgi:hypothetical protein